MDLALEREVRQAALRWLDERTGAAGGFRPFTRAELEQDFAWGGRRIPLVSRQKGIWKPAGLDAALSILTVHRGPREKRPYDDGLGADGRPRYMYRGTDPAHADNRALRAAMRQALPLIWFVGVDSGLYEAVRPVWLVDEEPAACRFVVAVDAAQRALDLEDEAERRYALSLTRQRVHQAVFRAQVIAAYGRCAMCRLGYPSLLDAAHILRDGHPRGDPVVPNGLALCKIHHAAFDQNLIGVHPERLAVEVRPDVRRQSDGPMLRHGLQEMQGVRLHLPEAARARPDPARLQERWEEFRHAM